MNFAIYFTLNEFIADLPKESVIYGAAYTQALADKIEHFVMLSSEATISGGTIHAVRLLIENEEGHLNLASEAAIKVNNLLAIKGLTSRNGLMLTEGLNDAMRLYGKTGVTYSLKKLDEMVAKAKEGKAK